MEIRVIGGFCYGVSYAFKQVLKLAEKNQDKKVILIGELVHNKDILEKLKEKEVLTVDSIHSLEKIQCPIIPVIRAHGATLEEEAWLKKHFSGYLDLTCPFVKSGPHKAAIEFSDRGLKVVIFGKAEHPEVLGIASRAKNGYVVYEKPDMVKKEDFKPGECIGVVAQTTSEIDKFYILVDKLKSLGLHVEAVDTYCTTTKRNQKGVKEIASWADLVIVVGDKRSSNTQRLAEICQKHVLTYKIENGMEIQAEWFSKKPQKIGIAAGASTPPWVIEDVKKKIMDFYS
jgi:(E)-4-hydroxy-3-methyl-but-2-enyl pyrophosphate reductase